MATWKAEFRAHHYAHKSRPRSAWAMGFIHRWARLAEPAPWLANAAIRAPGLSRLAKWAAGIDPRAQMPRFASATLRRRLGGRPLGKGARVILWPDTFNNHFRAETGMAAARLIAAAGYEVVLPPRPLCCGRPLYDWGYLDEAKALWEKTFAVLADDIAAGTPIIGLEPGCTSVFKDELPNLFPDRVQAAHLSRQVVHFSDFIAANFDRLPRPRMGGHALVQPHCHHHAVIGFHAEMQVLRRLGLHVERPPQGCCGMAGAFGFAKETHDLSVTIGERVLLPAVRKAAGDTIILADGFSCREQIEQHTGRATRHIADLLAERMLD
jgi:Fe-S oxidoreductase